MNIGLTSLFFANLPFVDAVYCYEPIPSVYEYAKQNIMLNKNLFQKIHPFNIGIGNSDTETIVSFDEDRSDCTSMMFPCNTYFNNEVKIKICRVSDILNSVLEENNYDFICMKINAEGAEYPIFDDLVESGMINNIKIFMMDTHFNRENEIKRQLNKYGFIYFDKYGKNGHSTIYAVKI